jgi:thioredoxin-dependent peroxiredoxin
MGFLQNNKKIPMITENTKAPDFTLPDSEGNKVSLSAFTGKRVLLVFYPADDSPVCTTILGINTDSIDSHKQFGEKNSLPFTLLSDHDKRVSESYDAIAFLGISQRAYVLIDEKGIVRLSFNDFLPLFYQSTRDLLAKIDAMKPE